MDIHMTWCEEKKAAQDRQKWKAIVHALRLPRDKEDQIITRMLSGNRLKR